MKIQAMTAIELNLALAIFLITAGIGMPIALNNVQRTKLSEITSQITSLVFYYQQNAYAGKAGQLYGVDFEEDEVSLFSKDPITGDELVQEVTILPQNTTIQNISLNLVNNNRILFEPGDITPSDYGTIEFTDGVNTYILEINAEGFIDYYQLEEI